MKTLLKSKNLPFLALILGVVGFLLRKGLYLTALDEKNLLLRGHPLELLLWLVTICALALIIVGVRMQSRSNLYADNFHPSKAAAIGSLAASAGVGATVLMSSSPAAGTLGLVWTVCGVLACIALAILAKFRQQGKQPLFLFHGIVCIFFAIHMVSCYQGWSSNPQIQDYVFTLLADLALMLFSYQHTAFDADTGNARLQLGFGLLAVFCCLVSLSGTEYSILYLTGGIWALTNLCGD